MARVGIYAVRDTVAQDIIGGLHLHRHDAAAVRMFIDAATDKGTRIAQHPQDYELICLGYTDETGQLYDSPDAPDDTIGPPSTILTGKQWLATITDKENQGAR